jgi:hypothetical protein
VWTLLAAVLVCGVVDVEAWPFSSFHLFSQVRTPHTVSYRVIVLDRAGRERPVSFGEFPSGFRGLNLDLGGAAASLDEQEALCGAMLVGARSSRPDAVLVRVYTVDRDLSKRVGRSSPRTSHLAFTCEPGIG